MTFLESLTSTWKSTSPEDPTTQSQNSSEEVDPKTAGTKHESEYKDGNKQLANADDNDSHESIQVAEAVLKEAKSHKQQTPTSPPMSALSKTRHKIRKYRDLCGKIVNDTRVQIFIILLIAINGIMLGLATFPFIKDDIVRSSAFEVTDTVFLIIFTIELGMQFIYNGLHLFLDGWLVFDFIVICTSWAFAEVQVIRAFRIFRSFRLITRVKTLQNLVTAIFSVVPRIAGITLCESLG